MQYSTVFRNFGFLRHFGPMHLPETFGDGPGPARATFTAIRSTIAALTRNRQIAAAFAMNLQPAHQQSSQPLNVALDLYAYQAPARHACRGHQP